MANEKVSCKGTSHSYEREKNLGFKWYNYFPFVVDSWHCAKNSISHQSSLNSFCCASHYNMKLRIPSYNYVLVSGTLTNRAEFVLLAVSNWKRQHTTPPPTTDSYTKCDVLQHNTWILQLFKREEGIANSQYLVDVLRCINLVVLWICQK